MMNSNSKGLVPATNGTDNHAILNAWADSGNGQPQQTDAGAVTTPEAELAACYHAENPSLVAWRAAWLRVYDRNHLPEDIEAQVFELVERHSLKRLLDADQLRLQILDSATAARSNPEQWFAVCGLGNLDLGPLRDMPWVVLQGKEIDAALDAFPWYGHAGMYCSSCVPANDLRVAHAIRLALREEEAQRDWDEYDAYRLALLPPSRRELEEAAYWAHEQEVYERYALRQDSDLEVEYRHVDLEVDDEEERHYHPWRCRVRDLAGRVRIALIRLYWAMTGGAVNRRRAGNGVRE